MRKKAQGLSVNVIIIAAIALIVLVVLIAIFTGRLGVFSAGVQSAGDAAKTCDDQGGKLKASCDSQEVAITSSDAITEGQLCCKSND